MNLGRMFRTEPVDDRGLSSSTQTAITRQLREARLRNARGIAAWMEIAEADLVRRGRLWVHVPTDEVLAWHRGVVFHTGSASVVADRAPLVFYVDGGGDCVFLERTGGTWSQLYARQVQREMVARP